MTSTASVIIIGGGPVGLALGVELAQRHVAVDIVEPCRDLSERTHPRARYVNVRSASHFRRWGLAPRMREIAEFPSTWPSDVVFMTQLAGKEIVRFRDAFLSDKSNREFAPEPAIQLVQSQVEAVLREELARHPCVTLHLGWRCVAVLEHGDEVEVTLVRDDAEGEQRTLSGAYLVGCDGAGSMVRRVCQFPIEGKTRIADNVQIIFEAPDFYTETSVGPAMMYWSLNERYPAFVSPIDRTSRFFVSLHKVHDIEELKERSDEIVRAVLGNGLHFRVLDWDPWTTNLRIVSNYRQGRVFLAGDAAHQHPTYGGHGLNLGLSDAVDLGWKLAAVMCGFADEALLDTYDEERRPIGLRILDESSRSFQVAPRELVRSGLEGDTAEAEASREAAAQEILTTKAKQFRSIGTQLGYAYTSSIVIAAGAPAPAWSTNEYQPSGAPGTIAPHHWLSTNEALYDRFGPWFTVLAFGSDARSIDSARHLQETCPWTGGCRLFHIEDASLTALYGAPLSLIRPDQHVAWRGNGLTSAEAARIWNTVMASAHRVSRPAELQRSHAG